MRLQLRSSYSSLVSVHGGGGATVLLKVVLTGQTGPKEKQRANRYLFPPGDFAESTGRTAVQVFV